MSERPYILDYASALEYSQNHRHTASAPNHFATSGYITS
jgi:hypothetical protein